MAEGRSAAGQSCSLVREMRSVLVSNSKGSSRSIARCPAQVTDTTTFTDEARRAEVDAWLYETCTQCLQHMVDIVVQFYPVVQPLLARILDLLSNFIRCPASSFAHMRKVGRPAHQPCSAHRQVGLVLRSGLNGHRRRPRLIAVRQAAASEPCSSRRGGAGEARHVRRRGHEPRGVHCHGELAHDTVPLPILPCRDCCL